MTEGQFAAKSAFIAPPVKGWNTRDALTDMDPQYAIELENYFPGFGSVDLRKGSTRAHTCASIPLAFGTYTATSGTEYLLMGGSKAIASYSNGSAETDISGAGSLTAGFIQFFQQFRTRMFMTTNYGNDDIYAWTGSGNAASAGFTLSGVALKNVGPMTAYRNRLYFAHRNTATGPSFNFAGGNLTIYYGDVDAITGAVGTFDLSSVFRNGGYIAFLACLTRAKNTPEDELFVAISNTGEIIIYQGTYPGGSDWGIIGHYFIPKPVGENCFFYFGSDLMIITIQGVFSLNAVMGGQFGSEASAILTGDITNIIKSAFTDAYAALSPASSYSYYWCGINYPRSNMLIINVPGASSTSSQFVMNTVTGAWCKFTGLNAVTFGIRADNIYFSAFSASALGLFDNGFVDTDLSTNTSKSRTKKMRPAYNFFGDPSVIKTFTEAQPFIYQSQGLDLTMDADVDFANTTATNQETDTTDNTYKLYTPRMGLKNVGNCASIRIDGTATTKRESVQAIKVYWTEGNIR